MHQGSKSPKIHQHISVNENVVCSILLHYYYRLILRILPNNAICPQANNAYALLSLFFLSTFSSYLNFDK